MPNERDLIFDHRVHGELLEVVHGDDGNRRLECTRELRDGLIENHLMGIGLFGRNNDAYPLLFIAIEMLDEILSLQIDEILKDGLLVALDVLGEFADEHGIRKCLLEEVQESLLDQISESLRILLEHWNGEHSVDRSAASVRTRMVVVDLLIVQYLYVELDSSHAGKAAQQIH